MDHEHSMSTKRIEAFSDGVFAIIVTLLVLDLRVPDLARSVTSQATWNALVHIFPQFLSFAMSFIILCIFWVNHHQFFAAVKQADRKILWLNNLLLFWLCFVPFPTAFLGRYPTNMAAVMLYGLVLFLAGTSFTLMGYYAMFRSKLYDEHVSVEERRRSLNRSYIGIILYGLSVVLAPISVYISLAIFFAVPPIYFVPRRITFS